MGACSRFFSQQYQVIFDPLKKTPTPTTHFQNLIILFTSNSKKEEAFFKNCAVL